MHAEVLTRIEVGSDGLLDMRWSICQPIKNIRIKARKGRIYVVEVQRCELSPAHRRNLAAFAN
jgi:hypothetical protein